MLPSSTENVSGLSPAFQPVSDLPSNNLIQSLLFCILFVLEQAIKISVAAKNWIPFFINRFCLKWLLREWQLKVKCQSVEGLNLKIKYK